jgi:phage tail sheath protein FI
MPVNLTYPGVYIEEVPSTVRTIMGVPTAVAAFVGPAARGPVDEPRHLTSWTDFERIYGGLSASSLMSYAVFHYYQNGGSEAEVVRVAARFAAAVIDLGNGVKLEARVPGAGNNLKARVDHDPADATKYTLQVKNDAQTFTIKADSAPDKPDSLEQQLSKSTLVKPAADTRRVKPPASPPAVGGDPFGDPNIPTGTGGRDGATRATIDLPAGKDANNQDVFVTLEARYPGAWANALVAVVDYDTTDPNKQYNLTVRDPGRSEETWRNIEADKSSSRSLDRVLEQSQLVRTTKDTNLTARPTDSKGNTTGVKTQGTDGPTVVPSELVGVDGVTKSGMFALRSTDIFTILCIPPVDRTSGFNQALYSQAATFCVERRSMLLVDPPVAWTDVDRAVNNFSKLPSGDDAKNAAVYFPWIKAADKDGALLQFPPSGAVAGVWARTDGQRNVAKAPAGTDASLSGVSELVVKLTDLENGRLNPLGVNCLRTFPVIGTVVWGARTLRGADRLADQWKYVPVRRTALFIEESLYRGTQWAVFEPNDEPLWAAIRLNVGAFMNTLFRQGMFQGRTPQEAYLVKCDKDNNPQNDIDRGIVNILVGFAPLKPAEFVVIHIQQLAGQIQV